MAYEVPKSKASLKQNRFEFRMPGSTKVYTVPLLKFLKPSIALKMGDMSELEIAKKILDTYLPEAVEKFDDADQLTDFMTAWSEASGISLGKSEASASS